MDEMWAYSQYRFPQVVKKPYREVDEMWAYRGRDVALRWVKCGPIVDEVWGYVLETLSG